MATYTNNSMAIPVGIVAAGVLSLLDQPTTRWALKPTVLGPCCLLGLAYLRSSMGTNGEGSCAATDAAAAAANLSTGSLLDMLAADVRQATCVAQLPPFFATLVGDLIGLLLCSQFLALALSARRALAAVRVELASGFFRGNPNAVARSGASVLKAVKRDLMAGAMSVGSQVPGIRGLIAAELASEINKMDAEFTAELRPDSRDHLDAMPLVGIPANTIRKMMQTTGAEEDKKWLEGKVSGAVYHGEAEHLQLLNDAYAAFSVCNPLHPDIWPSSMKFEAEVIRWVADFMRGGDEKVCGSLTSGGTESIVLAAKTHRDWAAATGRCSGAPGAKPEIIACVSAHAAIDKACDLLGLKLVKVPMDSNYVIDLASVRGALSADTIMVYSSAPSFPQGTIDPIQDLSNLCVNAGVGLHVDCCLGGFVLPFMQEAGFGEGLPPFDFGLPGVTSMSVDTHKYGYAAKGTSVVLYRSPELRRFQYFGYPDWSGGLYVTPTIAGSRPGALTAAAWASLASIGRAGFVQRTKDIVSCTRKIAAGVAKMDGLFLMGPNQAMIVCFGAKELNVLKVADRMAKEHGWSLNSLQSPASVHLCCTVQTVGHEAKFLANLQESLDFAKAAVKAGDKDDGSAAVYGMASSMPAGPVKQLLYAYTDVKYKV